MSSVQESEDNDGSPGTPESKKTINCLFCGGVHIFPGPRYENHLMNEHGVIFDVGFIIQLTLFKGTRGFLPDLEKIGTEGSLKR